MVKAKKLTQTRWDKWTPVIFEDVSGGVTRESIVEWAKSDSSVLAITREEADEEVNRPHYHCVVLYKEPVDRKTVNNRIRKYFPNMANGKTGMSCSQWDGSDNIYDYIYKGSKNDSKKGFDNVHLRASIDIQFHHRRWHDEHLRITAGLKKNESAEERRERFIKETVQHFTGKQFNYFDVSEHLFKLYKGRIMLTHLQPLASHILYILDPAQALSIHRNYLVEWSDKHDLKIFSPG